MLLFRSFSVFTKLQQSEIAEKLQKQLKPGLAWYQIGASPWRSKNQYEGTTDICGFAIRRLRYFGRDYFIPWIIGKYELTGNGTEIKFRISMCSAEYIAVFIWNLLSLFLLYLVYHEGDPGEIKMPAVSLTISLLPYIKSYFEGRKASRFISEIIGPENIIAL